ncbi:hypothetical protein DPMN_013776 [Dreissena polymorpha]|uniref:Uncharacterized protein n=1 Tax=Dreissena polymorpha TaxID=45954 RepID=A0A9D4N9K6_DREPO|nr:hypothetical protein DPMN_013776 [Dreissena polymorpha]
MVHVYANCNSHVTIFCLNSKWLILLGSALCVAAMFLINWWAVLVTIVIIAGLYFYVNRSKPGTTGVRCAVMIFISFIAYFIMECEN